MTMGFQYDREAELRRLDIEASMLAVAEADLEAGRVIADGDVDAWLDAWVRGEDVSLPEAEPNR